jgi:pantetheine-phosphate adenylyltransferase
MARVGVYPGTFDPPTKGHRDIIERALALVDKLVIGVGVNTSKAPLFSLEERVAMVQADVAALAGGKISVKPFKGLVVRFAEEEGARVIIRGLRGVTDFDYEVQMATANGRMSPGIETIFLFADPRTQAISGTLVREIARLGGDVSPFVSPAVATKLVHKLGKG